MSYPAADQAPPESRLSGRLLLFARAGWLLVSFLAVGVCILALVLLYADHQAFAVALNTPELASPAFARYYIGINAIFAAVCTLIAAIIFWRRSDDWMALLTALMMIVFGTISHNAQIARIVILAYPNWQILLLLLAWLADASVLCWFFLFPNGRFVPRWTRWLALTFVVWSPLPNLIFGNQAPDVIQMLVVGLPSAFLFGSIIATQIYRYRRVSTRTQRLQTKWVVYAVALFVGATFMIIIADALLVAREEIFISNYGPITVFYCATLLLPLSIGLAILRYRLYDIDVIIRRTLVYTLLTITLGVVYLGCILASRTLVAPLTGSSELAIVASTLAIAVLFAPLRRRIQNLIDRRFYRRKYDAAKVLAAFSATARDETDLEQLTAELLRVVDETMRPEFVGLWLRDAPARGTPKSASPGSTQIK